MGAKLARDLQAADAGQHTIEDHQVKGASLGKGQAIAAIQGDGHYVAVFREALPEQFRHPALILHHQNSHPPTEIPWYAGNLKIPCRGVGSDGQRTAGSRSITIKVNDPGNTGPRLPPAGAGPNFAETTYTR